MYAVRLTIFGLSLALMGSPSIADEQKDADAKETTSKVCVNTRTIRSFDGLSDEYLFVQEGSKSYYLMAMRNRCHGLRNANGIAIKNTSSRICSNEFGEITFRDRGGMGLQTCRIGKIEVVDSKDEAKALIEKKKQAKSEG